MQKKKIVMISDHPLSVSGVGCQSRYLINGLLKTGRYSFRCLGAAKKHSDYNVIKVNEDFIIRPIDGFGSQELIRHVMVTERPDALFIFTDPRFFMYLFEMEDEVHQQCPIAWWHVWDNLPWPEYNRPIYESVDLVNCHSQLTADMCAEHFPEKTNWIPHALPQDVFYPIPRETAMDAKAQLIGEERKDWFTGLWINRNAKRKRPNDVLVSWKMFLDQLEAKHGHRNAMLIMHTQPLDQEGPNLFETVTMLGINQNVCFSTQHIDFDKMNVLHNLADFYINISFNEGFGLGTLEAMQTGTPIIAQMTGGMTRQVQNPRDGSFNGIGLETEVRSLVGSQMVPYIYEDYVSNETQAKAIMDMYEFGPEKREELGKKAREYALSDFNYNNVVDQWDKTLWELMKKWNRDKASKQRWTMRTL